MNLPIDRSTPLGLGLAAVFGLVFGFLLDRGRVDRYEVIVNFFRLRDFRVLQIMLSAILIGGVGVYLLTRFGLATFHIKPLLIGAIVSGGLIFGIGMVILGYCPGTGVAALGTGSVHAWFGFLGMLVGSILYGVAYPSIAETLLPLGDFGKITLPEWTGIHPIVWWILLTIAIVGVILGTALKDNRVADE